MIEENAVVVAVAPDVVWVETRARSACPSCSSSSACGTSALSGLFRGRTNRIRISDGVGVEVGDSVVIGISEGALTRASLLVYLLPLVLFALCAYAARLADGGEGVSAFAGALGLFFGMLTARRLIGTPTRGDDDYQPLLLSRTERAGRAVSLPVPAAAARRSEFSIGRNLVPASVHQREVSDAHGDEPEYRR
jgi:sigma-E factor negative regulatory protein RseC